MLTNQYVADASEIGGRGVRSIRTPVEGKDEVCIDSTVALTCDIGPGAGVRASAPLR